MEGEHLRDLGLEAFRIPLLGVCVRGNEALDEIVDHLVAHVQNGLGDVLLRHDVDALLEDDLALVIHHVVVLQDLLADVEVARLDLLLRHLQALVHPRVDDRLALLQAQRAQHGVHAL